MKSMPPKNEGPPRKAPVAYFQKKEKADSDGKRRRRNDNVAKGGSPRHRKKGRLGPSAILGIKSRPLQRKIQRAQAQAYATAGPYR